MVRSHCYYVILIGGSFCVDNLPSLLLYCELYILIMFIFRVIKLSKGGTTSCYKASLVTDDNRQSCNVFGSLILKVWVVSYIVTTALLSKVDVRTFLIWLFVVKAMKNDQKLQ